MVLEAGVGTGRNLKYYASNVDLKAIDLSKTMLKKATQRALKATCSIELLHQDAANLAVFDSSSFDWIFSTFMCCVMPDKLQPKAIAEFERVLKLGGKFRLLEMVYSKNTRIRKKQELIMPFVEKIYGARFDRNTLAYIKQARGLEITCTRFLKDDTYLLIEGIKTVSF